MTPDEIRAAMVNSQAAAKAIEAKATAENREVSADELAAITEHMADFDKHSAELATAEQRQVASQRIAAAGNTLDAVPAPRTVQDTVTAGTTPTATGYQTEDARIHDATCGFSDDSEFYAAVQTAGITNQHDERLQFMAATGMSQGVGTDGGHAVPPQFATAIWDGLNEQPDNLLARTDQYDVAGESITITANAETSQANGSRYGGARYYWIAEAAAITTSFPKLRQIRIEPQEIAVLVPASDKLLRNSASIGQFINRAAVSELNFGIGDAIVNGTGAGQPLGILNAGSTIATTRNASGNDIEAEDIDNMWARLAAGSRRNAIWLINQDVEVDLQKLVTDTSTTRSPLFNNAAPGQEFDTLKNRPVIPVPWCATKGTKGDIILADMMGYASAVQGGIRSASSIHVKFVEAETYFRFMTAIDGQPYLASARTPYKGTNTQGQFITVAT